MGRSRIFEEELVAKDEGCQGICRLRENHVSGHNRCSFARNKRELWRTEESAFCCSLFSPRTFMPVMSPSHGQAVLIALIIATSKPAAKVYAFTWTCSLSLRMNFPAPFHLFWAWNTHSWSERILWDGLDVEDFLLAGSFVTSSKST